MKKVLILGALFLTSCSEPIKSPEYYYANINEAEKVFEKCVADNKKVVSENCINARKAIVHLINNRFNAEGLMEYKEPEG